MNKLNTSNTITPNTKVVAHHNGNGSELIPTEVKANTGFDNKHLFQKVIP